MDAETFLNEIRPGPYLEYRDYDFEKRLESFTTIAGTICPGFSISKEDREIYEQAIKYFAADKSCKYPLDKGLFFYGPVGVGKTLLFKILHLLNRGTQSSNSFRILTVNDLIDGITESGQGFWNTSRITSSGYRNDANRYITNKPQHLLLDDLGQSARIAFHYGNSIDVITAFIQRRYIEYTDKHVLTHISTNLEPDEIRELYGEFIASRLRQMCTPVRFPGDDKRK